MLICHAAKPRKLLPHRLLTDHTIIAHTLQYHFFDAARAAAAAPSVSRAASFPQRAQKWARGSAAALTDAWDFNTDTMTGDITLHAKWTEVSFGTSEPDATFCVGGRITLTPKIDGGEWDWDAAYFSATFNSPATFTALKAGTSTITYSAEGVSTTYAVTIAASTLPDTGQHMTWVWVLAGLAALAAAVTLIVRKRAAQGCFCAEDRTVGAYPSRPVLCASAAGCQQTPLRVTKKHCVEAEKRSGAGHI